MNVKFARKPAGLRMTLGSDKSARKLAEEESICGPLISEGCGQLRRMNRHVVENNGFQAELEYKEKGDASLVKCIKGSSDHYDHLYDRHHYDHHKLQNTYVTGSDSDSDSNYYRVKPQACRRSLI